MMSSVLSDVDENGWRRILVGIRGRLLAFFRFAMELEKSAQQICFFVMKKRFRFLVAASCISAFVSIEILVCAQTFFCVFEI